ncbi:MAG: helix-turn-helix domain-containing protein [Pseudomonas sp.]|jgi:SOS-response transcriptional repressor LexA|uniref:LexA family protein n=1 Tax=Pseudomonas sp. TaxID=306 RepID=UPI00122692E7|nr:XRE family transcriptional regulator [Pseudomonas sp.]RZI71655.1 MAG: helix-turn-helix domain-containing protein [Pseudomonas sp.]
MSIHRLIKEGRLSLGLSEREFADAVGVSRGAVQQWEKPGGTAPRRTSQHRVAQVLGISVAELVSGGSNTSSGYDMRAEVPLVSQVEAGNYTVVDNFKRKDDYEMVAVSIPIKRHTYALRVHGDSMVSEVADSFPEGSIIVVEPEMDALPGDYVIAVNEQGETTFKQLIKDGGDLYLKPLNTRYPIKLLGQARVIGVVREFTKRFR